VKDSPHLHQRRGRDGNKRITATENPKKHSPNNSEKTAKDSDREVSTKHRGQAKVDGHDEATFNDFDSCEIQINVGWNRQVKALQRLGNETKGTITTKARTPGAVVRFV
jgi:hypothetical protein